MKKTLLIAALTLMSTSAFASKARLTALGNADHLVDVQTIFTNPQDLHELKDLATFEFGPGAASATAFGTAATGPTANYNSVVKAEGGFIKSSGDAKWGFYLGHQNTFTNYTRDVASGFLRQENPIDIFYGAASGDMKWTASLSYSNSERKTAATASARKQNAMGARFGAAAGMWDASVLVGLGAKATGNGTTADDTVEGGTSLGLTGGYNMDSMYWFLNWGSDAAKHKVAATSAETKYTIDDMEIGVVEHSKVDGGEFFYGASYKATTYKSSPSGGTDTKVTTSKIPVLIGLEVDAASWLAVRGSISQDVLISSKKTDTGTTDENILENNTTVGAGVGLKWGKVMVDAAVAAATNASGAIGTDGNNFLTNASLTYNF